MYADDIDIEHAYGPKQHKILEKVINDDLKNLKAYFDENSFSVNVNKCQFMLIGTYQVFALWALR